MYGESPEKLTFYVGNESEKVATSTTFDFGAEKLLGTLNDPIILEMVSDFVTIYPNPFTDNLNLEVTSSTEEIITIRLYNMMYQLILSEERQVNAGKNSIKINPGVSQGTYFVQIEKGNAVINKKLLKK